MGASWTTRPVIVAMRIGLLFASNTVESSLATYVNFGVVKNRLVATFSNVDNWVCVAADDQPSLEITLKLVVDGITLSDMVPSLANALACFTEKCMVVRLEQSTNEFEPMKLNLLLDAAAAGSR